MRMNRTWGTLAAIACVLWCGASAEAQLAKQGTYAGHFGWYTVGKTVELEPGHEFFLGEYSARHGHDILYAGGELRRLIRSAPPQRAVTAVLGAPLERVALPELDRRPRNLGVSTGAECLAVTQSVSGERPPDAHLSRAGRANHTDSSTRPGSRDQRPPAAVCRPPTRAPGFAVSQLPHRNGSYGG
jgi:hypothetical protein